ncbi:MAG: peptidase M61 [Reichenbachiella sp.]
MKNILILAMTLLVSTVALAQSKYTIDVDLINVLDDRIMLTMNTPTVTGDSVEFHIPKIVPGTYSISDFGRFVQDFKAYDAQGAELMVDSVTANRRLITGAKSLSKITYWIEDTYDTKQGNVIFEPAGVNIEEGKNFVINTFGVVGYLEGMKDMPYEVTFTKPANMFGASALKKEMINDTVDVFYTNNYFDLADGPILYCEPDTTTFIVGGAEILVSVYSPNNKLESSFVKDQLVPTLEAQKIYMGGELPVKNYAFLIYLTDGPTLSGGMGALEHSYSSMYVLPEIDPERIAQIVRDVAAHEFFHIMTPLNIHSEEIGDFDFINPKMSKHLWLYEGMTEYAAGLAQVKYGEMSFSDYIEDMAGKIEHSARFQDDLPFTEMSKGCLDEYEDQYGNVYQKGALIGMSLDIRLRELSGGAYGVEEMMIDLATMYGVEQSFKDEVLFDTITALTFPEIRAFFDDYVEGPIPIPYSEFLAKVGLTYTEGQDTTELSLGNVGLSLGEDNRLVIAGVDQMNEFGLEMEYHDGDVLISINGEEVNLETYKEVFENYKKNNVEGDLITVVVQRENKKGKLKSVKLKGHALAVEVKSKSELSVNKGASEAQLALRKAWVNQ